MKPSTLIDWVVNQRSGMEQAIIRSVDNFLKKRRIGHPYANVEHDLAECQTESYNLGNGGDLCYDRFTTGAMYALFYQGRRINTSLGFCARLVAQSINNKTPLEVFDLGAGAGAVHVALAMCVEAALQLGAGPLPTVRVINIDISPVMLDFAANYGWPAFARLFPDGFRHVLSEYESVSWTNPLDIQLTNPHIVASYIFDHSDNRQAVTETFRQIVKQFDPASVTLTSSWNKRHLITAFAEDKNLRKTFDYHRIPFAWNLPIKGAMTALVDYRQELNETYNIGLKNHHLVTWDERSFYGVIFERSQGQLSLGVDSSAVVPAPPVNLYQSKVKVRRDIVLSRSQLKAARPDGRPTIILGSAGSGKSVVITERIKEVVERANYAPSLRILLTTFNKSLTAYLIGWLKSLLDETRCTFPSGGAGYEFRFAGSNQANITVLNFDKLPTKLGGLFQGHLITSKFGLRSRMEKAVERVIAKRNIPPGDYERILNPDFLQLEYVRVVYGLLYLTVEDYQNSPRTGRGNTPRLRRNSEERAIIWDCIKEYLIILDTGIPGFGAGDTIYTRRQKFYRMLEAGNVSQFTHIFVDEFQDCTLADYQLFYGLAKDNNEVVLTGDYAQAVHLGASVQAPRAMDTFDRGPGKMDARRNVHHLEGSYRLPFRITECLRPLSEYINSNRSDLSINIISPYRGAPPGARPILVYAATEAEMVKKLAWIHHHYQIFNFEGFGNDGKRVITILENDDELCNAINTRYHQDDLAATDTILRLKGMEKDCIVWSTRKPVNTPGDEEYFVYTILTRTRSVLIIALFDDTLPRYREIVSLLPQERLMVWDIPTGDHYHEHIVRNTHEQLVP